MLAAFKAGTIYFAFVFMAGFVLGTVRVFLVLPMVGEMAAVLLEIPLILFTSWIAAVWSAKRFAVPATLPARAAMGAVAFALLMLAELLVSSLIFGRTLEDTLATYQSPSGALGLSAQVTFALLPAVQATLLRRSVSRV